jgi:hypothetical protein
MVNELRGPDIINFLPPEKGTEAGKVLKEYTDSSVDLPPSIYDAPDVVPVAIREQRALEEKRQQEDARIIAEGEAAVAEFRGVHPKDYIDDEK